MSTKCMMALWSLVLRTFGSVFPYVEIWDSGGDDIVMLGSLQPWPTGPEIYRQGFNLPGVKSDLGTNRHPLT